MMPAMARGAQHVALFPLPDRSRQGRGAHDEEEFSATATRSGRCLSPTRQRDSGGGPPESIG